MTVISFFVPGPPRGKASAKPGRRGVKAYLYADKKTVSYEALASFEAHQAMAGRPPLSGAMHVTILIDMEPPQSASKKKRAQMLEGAIPALKKPDVDNVTKSIFDACSKIVFIDDVQVTKLLIEKRYREVSGVNVTIRSAP